jgi:ribonucleoside-triphosphate reductase
MDPPSTADRAVLGGPPCLEQSLESSELCCLVEVFLANHGSAEELCDTLESAFLYAKTVTLALPPWERTRAVMSRNRRIGTSLTGIAQFLANHSYGELE